MQLQTGSTTTMAYSSSGPLPASPTLTNPDMILPYGEDDSKWSPIESLHRPGTSGEDWSIDDMQFSIGNAHTLPITPTTPIIYGNGTMLSDIGEVTEAESTPIRKLPGPAERRMLKQAHIHGHSTPVKSSPTMGFEAEIKRTKLANRPRKVSIESTSTITSRDNIPADVFKDFDDDGISVDDSVFQGDDEESVADSYSEAVIASETQRLAKKEEVLSPEEDKNSSAALSRRAEQILLNAKKRLNNMEGNLTRARSSLFTASSGSLNSIHSSSPLSRLYTPDDTPTTSPGHTRVYSENSIASPLRQVFPARSASAAARYIGKGGIDIGQPSPPLDHTPENLKTVKRVSPPHSSLVNKSSPTFGVALEPLNEDETASEAEGSHASFRSSIDSRFSFTGEHRLSRSASTMQMRDLRDQMQDLKGRLSVLRDRARDDTMKRRSLQSLRTPSPFTAAEQWYATSPVYENGGLSADAGVAWKPEGAAQKDPKAAVSKDIPAEVIPEDGESDVTSVYEDVESHPVAEDVIAHEDQPVEKEEVDDEEEGYDTAGEGETIEDQEADFVEEYNDEMVDREELDDYESDASLYHDTMATQVSHEDREDAFDYEHFFLHSAMGTISRERRGSAGSFSSEDSVETTRGPSVPFKPAKMESRASFGHMRSQSSDTVSTIVTFATARDGTGSDHGDEEDRGNNEELDEQHNEFAVQEVDTEPVVKKTPVEVKRSTFGAGQIDALAMNQTSSESPSPPGSVVHDPLSRDKSDIHRPSVSSFDSFASVGTNRSFPLVNKHRSQSNSVSSTPDLRSREHTGSLLSDSATLTENAANGGREEPSPVHMLAKDDQVLVERLVASLGKCVLGLQESGSASYESRVWRRRLDAARRVLEGEEGAV